MRHRDKQLLKKIMSECKDVMRYTGEIGRAGFLKNDIYQKATAMSLLNIGEHANALTRDIWNIHEEIPWRKVVDLRNLVAHGYGELKMELIWNLSQKDIPLLIKQIENLLDLAGKS